MSETLRELVAAELSLPVDPRVSAMAKAIATRHAPSSRAVLFYGSCLRERQLGGRMLDFYLIVADYRGAYRKRWLAVANRLIPPNVFYFENDGLVAKYAVLSETDFLRQCGLRDRSTSVTARFAQPARLVWSANSRALENVISAVAEAAPALLERVLPVSQSADVRALWRLAFNLTFAAEVRAEREERSRAIVEADPERYDRFGQAALALVAQRRGAGPNGEVPLLMRPDQALRWWRRTQSRGKALSILRLVKGSFTFAGGAEYIAWKINRHAGTRIVLKPWQRRHPLLAGISLLPRLLKSGAIR
jgi:hypothetical protein